MISIYDDDLGQCKGCEPTYTTMVKTTERISQIIDKPMRHHTFPLSTIKSQIDLEEKIGAITTNSNDVTLLHTTAHGFCKTIDNKMTRFIIKDQKKTELDLNLQPVYNILSETDASLKIFLLDACSVTQGTTGKRGDSYDANLWETLLNEAQKEVIINLFSQKGIIDYRSSKCCVTCKSWGTDEKGGYFTKNFSIALAKIQGGWNAIFEYAAQASEMDALQNNGKLQEACDHSRD